MNIKVEVIPHKQQRYDTCGDWWFEAEKDADGQTINYTLQIRVSDLGDGYMEFCVAVHEQIEAMLCFMRGISEETVSDFDKIYETRRRKGVTSCQGEPGDHPKAPYRKEHFFATSIERLLAAELGLNWSDYDDKIMAL